MKYIKDIDIDNMTMETIPGTGGAYFDHDEEGTKELVDRVFYGIEKQQTEQEDMEKEYVEDIKESAL